MEASNQKSLEELRNDVKGWVVGVGTFIRKDSSTFFLAKTLVNLDDYPGVGGGNFVVAVAGIVTLEFFAGVFSHLTTQTGLWSEKQIGRLAALKEELSKAGFSNRKIGDLLRPEPVPGTMKDAAEAVRGLLLALREKNNNTGLPIDDEKAFDHIWNAFRNNLAHRMTPASGTMVASANSDQLKATGMIADWFKHDIKLSSEGPDFKLSAKDGEDYWAFQADTFATDFLVESSIFLAGVVDLCQDREKLRSAATFVEGRALHKEYRVQIN